MKRRSGSRVSSGTVITTIEMPVDLLTVTLAPADMISQRNVEAVTGIPPRVYLETIRSPAFTLPILKLGKLRIVERLPFLAYLRSLANPATKAPDTKVEGAAAVLAELGFALQKPQERGRKRRVKG